MKNFLEKGYTYVRRFVLQRDTLFSSSHIPPQQSDMRDQRDTSPDSREAQAETNGQPRYSPQEMTNPSQEYQQASNPPQGYPQQRGGMHPLIAGGLGAVGGGLAGYGLGQAVGGMQQDWNGQPPFADGQEGFGDTGEESGGIDSGGGDFGGE